MQRYLALAFLVLADCANAQTVTDVDTTIEARRSEGARNVVGERSEDLLIRQQLLCLVLSTRSSRTLDTLARVRSISSCVVIQLQTETRITRIPFHVAPPNQATPSS